MTILKVIGLRLEHSVYDDFWIRARERRLYDVFVPPCKHEIIAPLIDTWKLFDDRPVIIAEYERLIQQFDLITLRDREEAFCESEDKLHVYSVRYLLGNGRECYSNEYYVKKTLQALTQSQSE